MVVIVGFDVGGDQMGNEWHGWFGRWVNGGKSSGMRGAALVSFMVGVGVGIVGAGWCWRLLCDC
jgi:hypothetical protein